jgi:CO/xanthine dehydrogenase Mo-binding subunit
MSAASRTTNNMGNAIRRAVVDVKQQLIEMASKQLEISPDDLDVVNGTVQPKGSPDRALPFPALLGPARIGNILGRGTYQAISHLDLDGQGIGSPQWHPAVCAAEVEVDLETGRVTILKMHMALYVGRMINPLQCELQVEGAATFGIGQSLFEEILWDENGNLTNPNMSDYMVPSILDLPEQFDETVLEIDTLEVHGIGETSLPSVMPAVGNAVSRAIGKSMTSIPLTPEKVLRAMNGDNN